MKQNTTIIAATAIALFAMASCQKENAQVTAKPEANGTATKTISGTPNISIDNYGLLVFATAEEVNQYVSYLKSRFLAQVITFQRSKGFKSHAGNKYDNKDQTSMVTDEQIMDFVLDENGLVEINGTIFKPTDDLLSLLTIQKRAINSQNFTAITNANFNAADMNQFAINKEREEGFDLFKTIEETQYGISEGQIMYPGGGQSNLMKFWGKTESVGPCDETGYQLVTVTHWMFWIKVGYDWYYRPCVN